MLIKPEVTGATVAGICVLVTNQPALSRQNSTGFIPNVRSCFVDAPKALQALGLSGTVVRQRVQTMECAQGVVFCLRTNGTYNSE